MKLGMAQMCMADDMDVNLGHAEAFCREASAKGCDLLFFPEIQLTPFFPQYTKGRLFQGGAFYIASDLTSVDGKKASFSNPGKPDYVMPDRHVVYYGMVATKERKLLREQSANSFLFHDVKITTPEGKTEPLDSFDFSQHKLFMLGLYGNEYKIGIREKN